MSIPAYAISSLISSVVIWAFGVISLTISTRDRVRVTFAVFSFAWGTLATVSFILQMSPSLDVARGLAHLLPACGILTGVTSVIYVFALIDKQPSRTGKWKAYTAALAVVGLAGVLLGLKTDVIVGDVFYHFRLGYAVLFNWSALYFQVPYVALIAVPMVYLFRVWRRTPEGARRTFLRNNMIAILLVQLNAVLFAILLPLFGIPTFILAFHGFAFVAFFFYTIVARYQYRQIVEFNAVLEEMVDQRTQKLRETQMRLLQSEKMAMMGHWVAGVAHEMNSPLGAMKSAQETRRRAAQKLLERKDDLSIVQVEKMAEIGRKADDVLAEGIERVSSIVERLRYFVHLDESSVQLVDLNESVRESLGMLAGELLGAAEVETQLFETLPEVKGDPAQLNQLFYSVLQNALEAVDGDGVVRVHSWGDDCWAIVEVRDNGGGIPEDALRRVYEPGYTTKGRGVGIGMGLSLAYQVVKAHHGEIAIDSAQGSGTTVTIRFPFAS